MATINVSSASQLSAALSAAKAGDVIMLANGDYGNVTIDKNFTDYVTIKSANPLGAKFDTINIDNSSYLKLDGVHVDSPTNGGGSLIDIANSAHITVVNCEVNGLVDNVYPIVGPQFGIRADNSSYVTVSDNNVHDVLNGISFSGSDHLVASENNIDRIGADAFKFGGVDSALIENNTGPSYLYPTADAHSDFMQFQGYPSSNVTIRGNVFLPQNRFDTQGIFVAGDGGHKNVLIEDNIIYTKMTNAIFVAEGSTGITIRENTVISAVQGDVARIIAPDSATETNNIYTGNRGEMNDTNVSMQSNDPNEAYYFKSLFPNLVLGQGIDLADLVPKAGSVAMTKGAYDRLMDLLDGADSGGGGTGGGSGGGDIIVPPAPDAADLIYALNGDHEFNGTTASVLKVAHKNAFETDEGSIGFSFDADTVSGRHALVSKDAIDAIEGGNHMRILVVDGQLRAWFEDGDSRVRLSVDGIKANVEYDVMATFDDDTVKLYLNGKLVDSDQFVMNWEDNEQTLMIGGSGQTSTATTDKVTSAFDGTISDVHIWNAAMTPLRRRCWLRRSLPPRWRGAGTSKGATYGSRSLFLVCTVAKSGLCQNKILERGEVPLVP